MVKAALKFLHKHLQTQKCEAIMEQLIIPKRKASNIYVKQPQLGQYKASIDRIVELYNMLSAQVKSMTVGQFKRYMGKNKVKTQ